MSRRHLARIVFYRLVQFAAVYAYVALSRPNRRLSHGWEFLESLLARADQPA